MEITTTAIIRLTRGKLATINLEDIDLANHKWTCHVNGYAVRNAHGKIIRMHRVILERKLGRLLRPNEEPDHRDRDSLNNRRANLRAVTHLQNMWNRRCKNKSGFAGVDKVGHKWRARIRVDGQQRHLGFFLTPQAAEDAYRQAGRLAHGEFFAE